MTSAKKFDVEFTLSLNNRTGKFFTCQDQIDALSDLIGKKYFWRFVADTRPDGLFARILGRFAVYEINVRRTFPLAHRLLPLISSKRPVVFMDPREVIFHALKPADLVLCHDVGPVTHPDLYHPMVKTTYAMAFERMQIARPLVVFPTHSARREFTRLYGDGFRRLVVIPLPLRDGISNGLAEPVHGLGAPFLLTVGSVGLRKNQARAIQAFAISGLAKRGYSYVICGSAEPGFESVTALADMTPGVIRLGYVSDPQLRWLYRNASGFALPSLLEGFGMPAAEAIAHGLVPLVTRDSALHEVTGDAAVLVDALNVADITDGMLKLIDLSESERAERLALMKQSISRFSKAKADADWRRAVLATGQEAWVDDE